MVEKWHRHVKAELMSCGFNTPWFYTLPTVMLGLRTAVRLDTGLSPAEMVYGQVLKIQGDFCNYLEPEVDSGTFMQGFRRYLKEVKPVPVPHKTKLSSLQQKPFYYKDLDTCTHVLKSAWRSNLR